MEEWRNNKSWIRRLSIEEDWYGQHFTSELQKDRRKSQDSVFGRLGRFAMDFTNGPSFLGGSWRCKVQRIQRLSSFLDFLYRVRCPGSQRVASVGVVLWKKRIVRYRQKEQICRFLAFLTFYFHPRTSSFVVLRSCSTISSVCLEAVKSVYIFRPSTIQPALSSWALGQSNHLTIDSSLDHMCKIYERSRSALAYPHT